jgi:hypothetical protein
MKKILIVVMLLWIYGCYSKDDYRVYLIPEGYEGPVMVIEGVDTAENITKHQDTIIFDFRKSIVLRVKEKFIEGVNALNNSKYYYITDDGIRHEIPYALGDLDKMDSTKSYVHMRYSQIGSNAQCDLISKPKGFKIAVKEQQRLSDSLLSRRP